MDTEKKRLLYVGADLPEINDISGNSWHVEKATCAAEALTLWQHSALDVGLMYLNNPDRMAVRELEEFLLACQSLRWVALVTPELLEHSEYTEFIYNNFEDYHTLPIDMERLCITLGHVYGMARLKKRLSQRDEGAAGASYEMYGQSPQMRELFRQLEKISRVDSPVMLSGESGTGKELVARAVHQHSSRANGPFIAVNCGAMPEKLVQSELFGHEKGAFTGAVTRKTGKIEAACGGTIFLDEIGDLPYEAQANLLRFLQEGTIERVGNTEVTNVDVRVLAATHVDLEKAVEQGRFREDLYYRLNVLRLNLPPLREREGDVELLANMFFNIFSAKNGGKVKGFGKQAMKMMRNHTWPGNVRELINRVQRAVVMAESRLITPHDLGLEKRKTDRFVNSLHDVRHHAEKKVIMDTLSSANNNVSEASRVLGVSRVTLYRLMNKYELTRTKVM